jgi:hypothetical protein
MSLGTLFIAWCALSIVVGIGLGKFIRGPQR